MSRPYRDRINLEMLPEHCRDGVVDYIEHGIEQGSFLAAVLWNDLRSAVAHADMVNKVALSGYVVFLENYAPKDCWGSPEAVELWIKKGGLKGK